MQKIKIFDTTLRDGEQSPGATMTLKEKLVIADYLREINVDIVEAGFPAASKDDLVAVREIAKRLPNIEVAGLARVYQLKDGSFPDIDAVYEALKEANKPRLHVFISTSPQHIEAKFPGKGLDYVINLAVQGIKYGRQRFKENNKEVTIQFSPEDAARTSKEDLIRVVKAVTEAGVEVVNIPDTVGYMLPSEFARHVESIHSLPAFVQGRSCIAVHCHNDLGISTANALEAVMNGHAKQIECSLCGLGERGGMTSLEQVVMAIKTRKDIFGEDALSHINTKKLSKACKALADIIYLDISRYPIVGANAFSHEAGIHQAGQINGEKSGVGDVYEIMNPKSVGWTGHKIVLGKHSGWHAVAHKLKSWGYSDITKEECKEISERISEIADEKKYVFDHEVDDLMIERGKAPEIQKYKIMNWKSADGSNQDAQVKVLMQGPTIEDSDYTTGTGTGPIDAVIHAISNATGIHKEDIVFEMKSTRTGSSAPALITIYLKESGGQELIHRGMARNTNTVEAAAQAYVNALNRMQMYRALRK